MHDAIRSVDNNHIIVGPVVGAVDRPEWILGIKGYADAVFVTAKDPDQAKTVYDLIQTPVIGGGIAISAEADSPLAGIGPVPGSCCSISSTQEDRGTAYANLISTLTQIRATDGTYPVVGFHWWAFIDNFSEKRNYGLVTIRDNAFDGKEDKIAAGIDADGYTVGGEKKDYGNFLSAVVEANNQIYNTLSVQIGLFSPDTTAPTGTISINNGTGFTSSATVTLTLSASDHGSGMGAGAQMQFSNDNITWSVPEVYLSGKTWTLSTGDGTKTVYAKFKDASGNWMTTAVSDTIILDTTQPARTKGLRFK